MMELKSNYASRSCKVWPESLQQSLHFLVRLWEAFIPCFAKNSASNPSKNPTKILDRFLEGFSPTFFFDKFLHFLFLWLEPPFKLVLLVNFRISIKIIQAYVLSKMKSISNSYKNNNKNMHVKGTKISFKHQAFRTNYSQNGPFSSYNIEKLTKINIKYHPNIA